MGGPLRRLLPVRTLAWLTVRLLRWGVLPRLLRILPLLAGIGRLRLASRGRLPVRLLPVLPGLRLPVRIGRILPVRRLLPVVAHADKISAQDTWAQTAGASSDPVVVPQLAERGVTNPAARR